MEIEIKDGKVVNLEALMKGQKWNDWPSDEAICCGSHRFCTGMIENVEHNIHEYHHCNTVFPVSVTVRKTSVGLMEPAVLKYEEHLLYHRDPHSAKTYDIESYLAAQDLRNTSGPIEWKED